MTRQELIAFYEQRAKGFKSAIEKISTRINVVSNLRLATAIAFLALLYFGLRNAQLFYLLPLVAFVFFILVQKHTKLFGERVHLKNLLLIQENEIEGLKGNQSVFDPGVEFISPKDGFSQDMDFFGADSLFQYINRSKNISGRAVFARLLWHPFMVESFMRARQPAVRELATKTEFRHAFQALEKEVDEQPTDRDKLIAWLESKSFVANNDMMPMVLKALPAATITFLIGWIFVGWLFFPFLLCAMAQWAITGFYSKKITVFHEYITNKKNILEKYGRMLKFIADGKFESKLLQSNMEACKSIHEEVSKLASLVGTFDARLNWMTFAVVNSTILFDLQCVYRLELWKKKNKDIMFSLDIMYDTEALCSLANFAFNHPSYVYPEFSESALVAKSMGHPLIADEERINNDFELDSENSIAIVTGANMAGKSTFLRTLGVNFVLAISGAPVCASEFVCPLIRIRSGMRASDSLHDHQSYFYAELNRLKKIIDELKSGQSLFILLDEILKGTNSNDKQAGSIALVKQLINFKCLAVIATHDLALGDLEKEFPGKVRNFCFEPTIENDQLHFDYQLKTGVATKMNATFLMKKMGIIPQ